MALNIKETKPKESKVAKTYPRLMRGKISENVYVVRQVGMIPPEKYSGSVIISGTEPIGHFVESLDLSALEDYIGTITLSNKD